jgi:hypothetical protein
MNESTRSAIIAGLAIFAVAYAAATLDSTVLSEGGGGDGGTGGGGDGGSGILPVPESGSPPSDAVTIPFLSEILTVFGIILTIAVIAYVIIYRRQAIGVFLAIVASLVLLYLLAGILDPATFSSGFPGLEPGEGTPLGGGGGEGGGDGGGVDPTQPSPPTLLVLLVLGLTAIGGLVALSRTKTDDADESIDDSTGRDEKAAAIGRAAGRAADRLEGEVDIDNEVYKTWREMVELTDVDNPDTSTPGEFAAAAVETGLGRDDVTELTRLFEDVRYGNAEPSDERERQAIAIFRRIENRYTEEDP